MANWNNSTDWQASVPTIATPPLIGVARQPYDLYRRNRGNIGTRIFAGRTAATTTVDGVSGTTYQAVFRIAAEADWFAPIYCNGSTSTAYTVQEMRAAYIASLETPTTMNASTGVTWSFVGGSSTVAVARGTNRRKLVIGPRTRIAFSGRTDGGTSILLAVRAFIAAGAGSITVMGNGASGAGSDFTPWATRTDGLNHYFRSQAGNHVTTVTGFTSTTNESFSPICGVQYGAKGKVINVSVFGDSIDEGVSTYYGEGWAYPACVARQAETGIAVEYANFGWAGRQQAEILTHLDDAIADLWKPDIVFYQAGTPNTGAAPLVSGYVNAWRQHASLACSSIAENGGVPILRTVIPTNPSVRDWGSTDSLRVNYNDTVLQRELSGIDVWDFSKVMSGVTDTDGQVLMEPVYNLDNIHPNDAGNAAGALVAIEKLRKYAT